jgi:hypothetical protein
MEAMYGAAAPNQIALGARPMMPASATNIARLI